MKFEDLQTKIEGITNDFENGVSEKSETNTAILELVMFCLSEQKQKSNELLSEVIHTAFRKASDHRAADEAWKAIKRLPYDDWNNIMDFIKNAI